MPSAQRITVGATAVALNTASPAGLKLLLKNTSANPADLGDASVSAGAGGATLEVQLHAHDVLYAIRSGASNATIAVVRS